MAARSAVQVARLLDPHPKTFGGKIRQLWRALQLEWHLSKREILTLYLNRAPFGGTLQGIGAASWAYLGKSPANLSYSEAAMLAVLPQAPSRLRPDRWPERAEAARNKVLERMAVQGAWSREQVKEFQGKNPSGWHPDKMRRVGCCISPASNTGKANRKSLLRWMPVFNDVWKNWRKTGKVGCHRAAHWR